MLAEKDARWITLFTAGKVKLPPNLIDPHDKVGNLEDELRLLQAQESTEEQALKEVMLEAAIAKVEKDKDKLRKTQAFNVSAKGEGGKETTQTTRDKRGQQQNAFEAHESDTVSKIGGKDIKDSKANQPLVEAANAMRTLMEAKDTLANRTTRRSHIDAKTGTIIQRDEPLFSDKEIMDELYTPLVRELVLAETLIPAKYSATQKMIDGSDDYYIKECQEKGKKQDTGAAAFAKGAINLGASVATTVLSALGPVDATTGQQAIAGSNTLDSEQVTRAADITNGIAATLTSFIDIGDELVDKYNGGNFPEGVFEGIVKTIGVSIGKIVAGATGDADLGLVIADSIGSGASAARIGTAIAKWAKHPEDDPPWDVIINAVGGAISGSASAKSDQTDGDVSTDWGNSAAIIGAGFAAIARGSKAKIITCIRKGDWDTVFDFLAETGIDAGKAIPSVVQYNAQYNALPGDTPQDSIAAQQKLLTAVATLQDGIEGGGDGAAALLKELGKAAEGKLPQVPAEKLSEAMQEKFNEKQKKISEAKEKAELEDLDKIEERLKKENEEYQESLLCLGSKEPTDSEYKSIARLVAQLERDRAIWKGLTAMFGGGIGAASGATAAMTVASEVAPALKAAGQLVKFIINLKAAAERLVAWLKWQDAQDDAISAVSPYATAINNFASNQGTQFSHYTVQAAANAIQALLACGEMSPFAPAFKVSGAAVGATAAAEELIYKFYKEMALRKAWKDTREALDPKNKGNRKMALLAREINPTLAKYTIAYGAMIAKDPIAITALNRCGLDRETLARAKDGVNDVRSYLETLYEDDGTVLGMLPVSAPKSKVKVPDPTLTVKAWSLSCTLWQKNDDMDGDSPPLIVASLVAVENFAADDVDAMDDEDFDRYVMTLVKVGTAFRAFSPVTREDGSPCGPAEAVTGLYADLAESKAQSLKMARGAALPTAP